jgi:hypothetical protein
MTEPITISRPKRILRAIGRVLGYTAAAVAVALIAWHYIYKYSGSGKWEFEFEKKGVKVYSLKVPGETLKQFKAVTRVKTSLNRAAAAMISTETEDCADWMPGCTSERAIQPFNARNLTYTHLYRLKYPSPFTTRDFIIHARVNQDPATKAVLVAFQAKPDAAPRNECCVRVERLNNTWRFTPLGNGEVEAEAIVNADQKLPYFMVNKVAPASLYVMCRRLQKFLDKDKWQQAKLAHIVEPSSQQIATR